MQSKAYKILEICVGLVFVSFWSLGVLHSALQLMGGNNSAFLDLLIITGGGIAIIGVTSAIRNRNKISEN